MRKLFAVTLLLCLAFFAACSEALTTDTPTLVPIPAVTDAPATTRLLEPIPASPSPPPLLTATILPDAEKSFKQVSGRAPFTVPFGLKVSGGAPPYTYEWDFDGDGMADSTAASPPPPHIYSTPRAYNAILTVRDTSGQEVHANRRIVAFGTPQMPDWKYGITAHLERRNANYYPTLADVDRAARLMREAGVEAVRMDFNWDMMNPTPEEWKFELYDEVVEIVREHDLEFLGIVDYVSWWASSAQDSQDWRVRLFSAPLNDFDFAHYTYEVVNHFKDDVHVWQLWNEPNTEGFWKPKPDPARYVSLLQEAYLAAKYADPEAVVLFAGMSSNGIEGNDNSGLVSNFIENAYNAGASGYFDVMAIHPYMLPEGGIETLRAKIQATRNVMDRYGDSEVPLWLTEMGVPSEVPWWSTAPPQSEENVANWLRLVYTEVWDLTPTIFWYQLQDRNIGDDPEGHFGILRADFSPKRAYEVLTQMTGEGDR